MKWYQMFSNKVNARDNCIASGNTEWQAKHEEALEELVKDLPSGSGFDSGTKCDWARTTEERKGQTCFREEVATASFLAHHITERFMGFGFSIDLAD